MNLRKRGIAYTAGLLLGSGAVLGGAVACSGDVGPDAVKDDWGASGNPSSTTGNTTDAPVTAAPGATTIDNGDGTTTIKNPDGSEVTVDGDGNVVSQTPAPVTPGTEVTPTAPGNVPAPPECTPGTPKTTQIPRLTNLQYDNTVADLIGVDLKLSQTTLATESKGNMDTVTLKGFQTAAANIASTIITDATARAKVITCTTGDAACATDVITNFGAKVFRRPLTTTEVDKYVAVFNDTTLTETGTFDEQLQVVLEALFQSPYFVTVAEASETAASDSAGGQVFALSGHEVAARLSYMLWDTTPDDALIAAAAAGSLTTDAGIAEQATRMLGDARAAKLVERMHGNYMRMGAGTRWEGYSRDAATYPLYSPDQAPALSQETLAFATSIFENGGTFQDLMTSTKGFVNADTAPLYGLNAADYGAELEEADLGATRPGILTRAGFLAANAYGNRTSPIFRGAFVQKFVLCATIGDPSPEAAATPLPDDANLVTNRQKTDAQTAAEAGGCKACHHTIINPAGFAFEGFDGAGGVQTMDNGVAVDTTADVLIDGNTLHVTGAADLVAAIASSPGAYQCYSKKWVEVGYNRVLSGQDQCTVNDIASRMSAEGYSVKQLITDLATVESFRYRALEN
jgi:hypothetical protein